MAGWSRPGYNPTKHERPSNPSLCFCPARSLGSLRCMSVTMRTWQLLGVILASAFFWMHYVQMKDAQRTEPRRRLFLAFLLGIVAWALAVLCFLAIEATGLPDIKF